MRKQDSFSKRDLSASPNDGLPQNVKIDLRTTRRHRKFRENFVFRENIFAFCIFAKFDRKFLHFSWNALLAGNPIRNTFLYIPYTHLTALLYVQYINVYSCNFSALYSLHPFHNCSPAHIKINVYSSNFSRHYIPYIHNCSPVQFIHVYSCNFSAL